MAEKETIEAKMHRVVKASGRITKGMAQKQELQAAVVAQELTAAQSALDEQRAAARKRAASAQQSQLASQARILLVPSAKYGGRKYFVWGLTFADDT